MTVSSFSTLRFWNSDSEQENGSSTGWYLVCGSQPVGTNLGFINLSCYPRKQRGTWHLSKEVLQGTVFCLHSLLWGTSLQARCGYFRFHALGLWQGSVALNLRFSTLIPLQDTGSAKSVGPYLPRNPCYPNKSPSSHLSLLDRPPASSGISWLCVASGKAESTIATEKLLLSEMEKRLFQKEQTK